MRRSLTVLRDGFDAENARFAGARLRFFEGARATERGSFPAGVVLATINCPTPLFNPCTAAEAGSVVTLTANKVTGTLQDLSADASGTLGSFAFDNGSGVFLGDGTVGLAGSGAHCIVDRTDIQAGASFTVSHLTQTSEVTG